MFKTNTITLTENTTALPHDHMSIFFKKNHLSILLRLASTFRNQS